MGQRCALHVKHILGSTDRIQKEDRKLPGMLPMPISHEIMVVILFTGLINKMLKQISLLLGRPFLNMARRFHITGKSEGRETVVGE